MYSRSLECTRTLGNVTNKKDLKINIDKVLEALDYLKEKNVHYDDVENQLISFLPVEKKDQYLSKKIEELYKIAEQHVSSLSDPELKRQYSGDRTKVRRFDTTKLVLDHIAKSKKIMKVKIESSLPVKQNPEKLIEQLVEKGLIIEIKNKNGLSYLMLTDKGKEFRKEYHRFLKLTEDMNLDTKLNLEL